MFKSTVKQYKPIPKTLTEKKQQIPPTPIHPILNNEYFILRSLGEGKTSRVYLCQSISDSSKTFALKIIRDEYLAKDQINRVTVQKEMDILTELDHQGIVKVVETGWNGSVNKQSGSKVDNLVYLLMEHVSNRTLFNLCENNGALGEDIGRFFLHQIVHVLSHIHDRKIVHRDIKLENILLTDNMTIKLADFGFARKQEDGLLQSQRGTMTYMAPEIKLGYKYDGKKADIFSVGVVLFIIVLGIFPFQQARSNDYFYNLMQTNQLNKYWLKVDGIHLSDNFKSLITSMLTIDAANRPTLNDIINHPWFNQKSFHFEKTRAQLIRKCQENQQSHSTDEEA